MRASRRLDQLPEQSGVEVVLFHDVLCAWSYVADQRLEQLRDELGPQLRWRYRGYPLRPEEKALDKRERKLLAGHFRRAAREKEGAGVVADLWTSSDPPRSSLPPLVALEAALVQGEGAQRALLRSLRQSAFLRGVNIARRDVLVELAESASLDVGRFLRDLDDPRSLRAVEAGVDEAGLLGVRGVPALLIGDEWLMQGCRDLPDYRAALEKFLSERTAAPALRTLH